MEIIYAMGGIFAVIFVYYTLRSLITGKPGPFDTVTYVDNYSNETYKEIINYLEDKCGPSIVFKMSFRDFEKPNHYQHFLIRKSQEKSSKIKIEVFHEE